MRQIDRLVLKEIVGPWLFGVGIFTVLILAGTYLFRITDYLAKGVSMMLVGQLTVLLLPGIMAKTFSMAMLLASLLSFGRLSSDSEIVALRAAGASIGRIMLPVGGFGLFVAIVTFFFNEAVVPQAALGATSLQADIAKNLDAQSFKAVVYTHEEKGKLKALVTAKDFSFGNQTMRGAVLVTYDDDGEPRYTLHAKELRFVNDKDWRLTGGGVLQSVDGRDWIQLSGDAWPPQIPEQTFTPKDLLTASLRDLDSFSMAQMREQIQRVKMAPTVDRGQIANLEYGYYNKISLPLAAFVFGLVGAPLGIRNHRTGAAAGFWLSVVIIFGYMMLANAMAIVAKGGAVPAWLASFMPLVIGTAFAAITISRKNKG